MNKRFEVDCNLEVVANALSCKDIVYSIAQYLCQKPQDCYSFAVVCKFFLNTIKQRIEPKNYEYLIHGGAFMDIKQIQNFDNFSDAFKFFLDCNKIDSQSKHNCIYLTKKWKTTQVDFDDFISLFDVNINVVKKKYPFVKVLFVKWANDTEGGGRRKFFWTIHRKIQNPAYPSGWFIGYSYCSSRLMTRTTEVTESESGRFFHQKIRPWNGKWFHTRKAIFISSYSKLECTSKTDINWTKVEYSLYKMIPADKKELVVRGFKRGKVSWNEKQENPIARKLRRTMSYEDIRPKFLDINR